MLPNISRRTGNQIIKFGHLIEYKLRKYFLKMIQTKCDGEISPRLFSKNQN